MESVSQHNRAHCGTTVYISTSVYPSHRAVIFRALENSYIWGRSIVVGPVLQEKCSRIQDLAETLNSPTWNLAIPLPSHCKPVLRTGIMENSSLNGACGQPQEGGQNPFTHLL